MINPQKEKGHIQIATGKGRNDVFGALAKAGLKGIEYQIVLWVIRKTWGFKKKEDWISLTQFEKDLGISRSYLCRAIKNLVTCKVLVTRKSPGKTFYSFNKLFDEWVVTHTSLVTPASRPSDVEDNQLVTPTSHTKETSTKETIQKGKNRNCPNCSGTGTVAVGKARIPCGQCR